jgi:radical SAM superfamily enzyme YgiQ (UPF0313 family)
VILLYNPPSSAGKKPILPMSLLALAALLEGRHETLIVDGNLESDPMAALDRAIEAHQVDILAVTVMPGPQLQDAVPVCRALKARHREVVIVWGGYFPTQHADACLRADYVDVVIRGHGEEAFVDLVNALRAGGRARPAGVTEALARIPGVAVRDRSGAMVDGGKPPLPHPDRLPDFPYHRVDMARYPRRTFLGSRTLAHHSSYGCPFTCNFCAVVNLVDGRWLPQSAERTARVVTRLHREHGVDAVEFYDNNFFVHETRTVEFAERIRPLGMSWWGEARVDTLLKYDERSWATMADAGLRMMFMGAESGSVETLARMNKGGTQTPDTTLAIAERARRFGIVPEFSFVMGNPPDPAEDVRSTIAFIREVKRVNPASEIILYMYTPVPLSGTLFEEAKASGFRFPETLDEWTSTSWREFSQRRSSHTPWMDDPVRRRMKDFERVLNAYYPTVTDPRLGRRLRGLLRLVSAFRYRTEWYRSPIELQALHRILAYQRPETAGF